MTKWRYIFILLLVAMPIIYITTLLLTATLMLTGVMTGTPYLILTLILLLQNDCCTGCYATEPCETPPGATGTNIGGCDIICCGPCST